MKILFVDILTDNPESRAAIHRDVFKSSTHAEWFRREFGLTSEEWTAVDATSENLPNPADFDGIVIGGSTENPTDPISDKPWMKKTFDFIREIEKGNIPLLGICGGMQFTVRALQHHIIFNPKGRRIGTPLVRLTPAGQRDVIFKGLPKTYRCAASHRCIVAAKHPTWTILASSNESPFDALAIGDKIRLVQFHPEMSVAIINRLIKQRREDLIKEGLSLPERQLPNRAGRKILKNFLRMVKNHHAE